LIGKKTTVTCSESLALTVRFSAGSGPLGVGEAFFQKGTAVVRSSHRPSHQGVISRDHHKEPSRAFPTRGSSHCLSGGLIAGWGKDQQEHTWNQRQRQQHARLEPRRRTNIRVDRERLPTVARAWGGRQAISASRPQHRFKRLSAAQQQRVQPATPAAARLPA